ncbi:hypothetical protein [Azospirillum melinis]
MFISKFVSLWEAAEIAHRSSGQDGRRIILAALGEGAIEAEVLRSDNPDPFAPKGWQRPRFRWDAISIAWGPYSSGLDPSRDVRLRRTDIARLWPMPSSTEQVEKTERERQKSEECDVLTEINKEECKRLPQSKRGPKSVKFDAVKQQILECLRDGRFTPEYIRNMKQEAGASAYGVNRETYRKARDGALSEFLAGQTPTNTD